MSTSSTVAIVGSGPVGTAIAYYCATHGIDVTVFERGIPSGPFPFTDKFIESEAVYASPQPFYDDLQSLEQVGDYKFELNYERMFTVGGAGTTWSAQTPRFMAEDFKTKSRYGYGTDWPVSYADLEPYLCQAEAFLGVSGTDDDNPFAPPRSQPYPLPPFELGYYEGKLADRAKAKGIVIHTTPQARARKAYEGRNGCLNYGVCWNCPTGARYAPNFHLQLAAATGHCTIVSDTTVRRIMVERGRVRGVVIRRGNGTHDEEHAAEVVVVAGGAIESTRLLLMSGRLGNAGGQLGHNFILKHIYRGHLHFKDKVFPNRLPFGAQTQQFAKTETRGKHGGIRLNLSSPGSLHDFDNIIPAATSTETKLVDADSADFMRKDSAKPRPGVDDMLAAIRLRPNCMRVAVLCESLANPDTHVDLSTKLDRFGDGFAKITVKNSEFDHATYDYARRSVDQVAAALDVPVEDMQDADTWTTGHHHFGGARMSESVADGVVTPFGEVHGVANLFVHGGALFVSMSGSNPTLTMVAIALRAVRLIEERAKA